jgi:ComF family protein
MRSTPFAQDAIDQAHLLLPIPLSAARLAERGFNQSLLLALQLSPSKTQSHLLLRTRHTQAQSQLNRQARLSNLLGAFAMSPLEAGMVRGQHILLIDDVMTSGATLNLAASVLKQAGAKEVCALVLAKTPD